MDTRSRGRDGSAVRLTGRPPKLVLVTNDAVVSQPDFLARAARVLEAAEVRAWRRLALQLRAHDLGSGRFQELAVRLRAVAMAGGSGLWINDRVDVAACVRADGVQLGARGVPVGVARGLLGQAALVGYSAHAAGEAEEAFIAGADLVVLGNVYPTGSHPGRAALGLAALLESVARGRPIVAIGGITPERAREVVAAGAYGVAVLGGVWSADDEVEAVRRYIAAIEAGEREVESRRSTRAV